MRSNSLLIYVALYTTLIMQLGCSGGDPTATDPELIFKDGFENAIDEIELLADGGTMVRGFSAWLKILPKQADIRLRKEADYDYVNCQTPAVWFMEAIGDKALSKKQSHLSCREYSDNRFDFDNGRWVMTDSSSGIVYYRVWKLNR
ncbi:MAG: hypothetical protein ABW139_08235 [Candidatus Thiodiazotropha sp. DIVDIV]